MTTVYKLVLSVKEFDVKEAGCLPPLATLCELGFKFRENPNGGAYAVLYTEQHPSEWKKYLVNCLLNSKWGERIKTWAFEPNDDYSGRSFDLRKLSKVD